MCRDCAKETSDIDGLSLAIQLARTFQLCLQTRLLGHIETGSVHLPTLSGVWAWSNSVVQAFSLMLYCSVKHYANFGCASVLSDHREVRQKPPVFFLGGWYPLDVAFFLIVLKDLIVGCCNFRAFFFK